MVMFAVFEDWSTDFDVRYNLISVSKSRESLERYVAEQHVKHALCIEANSKLKQIRQQMPKFKEPAPKLSGKRLGQESLDDYYKRLNDFISSQDEAAYQMLINEFPKYKTLKKQDIASLGSGSICLRFEIFETEEWE